MKNTLDICQSCGMPLKDPNKDGTNSNGGKSGFCYQSGKFSNEGIS